MKVTEQQIESVIEQKYFYNLGNAIAAECPDAPQELINKAACTTKCVLFLKNNFVIVGKSACVDPSEYSKELGEEYAYKDAFNQIRALEGYVLANLMKEKAETEALLASLSEGDCDGCKI